MYGTTCGGRVRVRREPIKEAPAGNQDLIRGGIEIREYKEAAPERTPVRVMSHGNDGIRRLIAELKGALARGEQSCIMNVHKWGMPLAVRTDIPSLIEALEERKSPLGAMYDSSFMEIYRAYYIEARNHFGKHVPDGLEQLNVTMKDVWNVALRNGRIIYRNPAPVISRKPEGFSGWPMAPDDDGPEPEPRKREWLSGYDPEKDTRRTDEAMDDDDRQAQELKARKPSGPLRPLGENDVDDFGIFTDAGKEGAAAGAGADGQARNDAKKPRGPHHGR